MAVSIRECWIPVTCLVVPNSAVLHVTGDVTSLRSEIEVETSKTGAAVLFSALWSEPSTDCPDADPYITSLEFIPEVSLLVVTAPEFSSHGAMPLAPETWDPWDDNGWSVLLGPLATSDAIIIARSIN